MGRPEICMFFKNRVLSRMFKPEREEVKGDEKLYN
jgi:hypothetical protein